MVSHLKETLKDWPLIVNLANSILGVSLLAMPYCFQKCGLVFGTVLLLSGTWLTYESCCALIRGGIISESVTLEQLGYHCFGNIGKLSVEISVVGVQLGMAVAYLVAVGDLGPLLLVEIVPGLSNGPYLAARSVVTATLALGVALPLSLRRSLAGLASTSLLSACLYLAVVAHVVVAGLSGLYGDAPRLGEVDWWRWDRSSECMPIFALAYACQTQMFLLYDALPEPSLDRMKSVLGRGLGICLAAYVLVGMFGCAAFGREDVGGNVLLALPLSTLGSLVRLGFVVSSVLSFPLIVLPCRDSLDSLCSRLTHDVTTAGASSLHGAVPMSDGRLGVLTSLIIVFALITAILFPNVQSVLAIVGATMGCTMSFVLPPLLYLKAVQRSSAGSSRDILKAKVVLVCGIVVLITGTWQVLFADAPTSLTVDTLATGDFGSPFAAEGHEGEGLHIA